MINKLKIRVAAKIGFHETLLLPIIFTMRNYEIFSSFVFKIA